jgi:hypothetical protein
LEAGGVTLFAGEFFRDPRPGGWTDADQAEWAVLAHELAQGSIQHHERCSVCASVGGYPCPGMRKAWEIAEEWLTGRRLLSRAQHLRAELDNLTTEAPTRATYRKGAA